MSENLSKYKETQVLTASSGKLLLMLYEACLNRIDLAVSELSKQPRKIEVIHNHIIKAQEIVGELLATLDLEKGGKFAISLQSLYFYILKKLVEANMAKSKEPLVEVRVYLQELYESWEVAVKKTSSELAESSSKVGTSGINISG